MSVPLNKKNEGGVISSETFNLTRITTVLAGAVAAVTAISPDRASDLWGFNPGQRLVLVVAAVAAIALISCADIMGRAVAAGGAGNAPIQVLKQPQPASRAIAGRVVNGQVLAFRPGAVLQVLFYGPAENPALSWHSLDELQM